MERLRRNPVPLLLCAALLSAAVLTLVLTAKTTYFGDNWNFLMARRDLGVAALLEPHNEHIVVIPVLIEQLLLRLFGMDSARPEQLLLIAFLLVTASLLYVYVRRRVGSWLALLATVLVLFLGPAWEVLLWPFEITLVGPVMFGLAMLLALEREDRRGDLAALACLTLALGFSNLGVIFIAAAAVAVLIGPREAWLRRSYLFLLPAALFALWYLGWGSEAESHMSLRNVLGSPQSVLDSAAVALGALSGLGTHAASGTIDLTWGRVLLVALVAVIVHWKLRAGRRLERWLWPVAAAALANWLLTAFNLFPGRDPSSSRYQYAGAIFVVMVLANLFKGIRPSRPVLLVLTALTGLALGPNLVSLKSGSQYFEQQAVFSRAGTAAIEIARDTVAPDFQLNPEVAGTPSLIDVRAGKYLEAVDRYGSPAYTLRELLAAPSDGRRQADIVLAQALPLSTVTHVGSYRRQGAGGCVQVPAGAAAAEGVPLPAGATRIEVPPGPAASVSLRRFATDEFPVSAEPVPGGAAAVLRVPRDQAPKHPWYVRVQAERGARVCR